MEQVLEILAPAGIANQTPLDAFQHNAARAAFRRPVVDLASLYASWVEVKGGRKVRLSLASNPEQGSKAMRGVMRSVVAEALWLYQCAPDGVNPINWTIDRLAEQLAKHEVIVAEFRDEDGVQQHKLGEVSQDAFRKGVTHFTAAVKHGERVQNKLNRDAFLARQERREAEREKLVVDKANKLKAALNLPV